MNIIVKLNGQDVTDSCLLSATRIAFDTSKRITTASITIMGNALNAASTATYDASTYDHARYSIALREMFEVVILDGRDGTTKLFDGQIYAMTMQQSDAPSFSVFYQCDLNDWAAWLDRSVCWDTSFSLTLPNSDKGIITALLGQFCPRIHLTDIASIVPTIQKFDWATKTCRQVLDDLSTLSMGAWRVDFDANLHYYLASAAPSAPFGLSTSPDYKTTWPVKVEGYKHDFTNPVNRAYVRGNQDLNTGAPITASYSDPVSIQTYGEYAAGVVDDQIVNGWDAALKAKSTVLANAYPIETGNFTIWGPDGLQCGMQVHIHEDSIGIDGNYTIRALTMQWVDQSTVVYTCQFGAAQPDLETILRILDQRTKWSTSVVVTPQAGPPADGSVTDASIAAPGLSASSIQSVNAGSINGFIQAGQIQSVNAGSINGFISAGNINAVNASAINGLIQANQIYQVTAGQINGSIQAGQIGSVNASVINGVVVSSQLADQIIDNLAKYATALTPIQMIKNGDPWPPTMPNKNFPPNSFFYYQPDGNFYQVNAAGTTWTVNNNPKGSLMSFYYIGAINAQSITGLIVAAQIGSITAGQITGSIQASQIAGVNASVIAGPIQANQIQSVNATAIQGGITSGQITSITSDKITGTIQGNQIGTIAAGQITGTLAYNQIGSINAATITVNQIGDAQISALNGGKITAGTIDTSKLNANQIDIGQGGGPQRLRVIWNSAVVAQIGYLGEVGVVALGGWFQMFGAGGTSYANAPIYTDSGGNLFIRNPSLTSANLTDPNLNVSGQLYTSPTTFDQTYSTLAWINKSGTDQASFVSRGLVLYYNGSKVGSVVRAPGGGWMEIECTTGSTYVLISGNAGIRSDGGYKVGGTTVINSSGQFVGTFAGSISTSFSISTSSSVNATNGYTGGVFQGSSVSVNGSCYAAGGHSGGPFTGSSISTSGSCYAGGGYSGGNFTGSGVAVSGGVGGAGFNPNGGYIGQTWNVAIRDNAGNPLQVWVNGINRGQVQLIFVGGVLVSLG